MSDKITADHMARTALVYVRQSSLEQVIHHKESQRRQYALVDRAKALGWQKVEVIDDDLGRSGGGVERPGFDRLLAAVGRNEAGAVFAVEASRLARNGRDWHTLLDLCGLVDALIIDEDGIYTPRLPNDRLLLGMKGTMSEMELSTFRQRSQEALKLKASRGELFTSVAVGYVRCEDDRIEKDPDQRVQSALALVFKRFRELGSARQVLLWMRDEKIELPTQYHGAQGREIVWKKPVYNTIWHLLTNPVYAGAYAYGRTRSEARVKNGRKHITSGLKRDLDDWQVLLHDQHDGYISWGEFESNLQTLANNANRMGERVTGSPKRGSALLSGLLRCFHCGRKLHVHYSGKGGVVGRYGCRGAMTNHGTGKCIDFGSVRVDRAVSEEVLRVLSPMGVEAALTAHQQLEERETLERDQYCLALEQARIEADRARRQFDRVEPENRLVAAELERRWNAQLAIVSQRQTALDRYDADRSEAQRDAQREHLAELATDLLSVWGAPRSDITLKKRILRTVLEEIVVELTDDCIRLRLHWCGGDHTELRVQKNRKGEHRYTSSREVIELIESLARHLPDQGIAATLNRLRQRTAKGNTWTESRVCSFRNKRNIAVYKNGERQARGELLLKESAERLSITQRAVRTLIDNGQLPAQQVCPGAPWIILEHDVAALDDNAVQNSPSRVNERQESLDLQ